MRPPAWSWRLRPRQYGRVSLTPPLPTGSPPEAGQLAPNYPVGATVGRAASRAELPRGQLRRARQAQRAELPDWPAVVAVLVIA